MGKRRDDKHRRTMQPSTALAELIHLVNLVPRDAVLEELSEPHGRGPEAEWEMLAAIDALPETLMKLKLHLREPFQGEVLYGGVRIDLDPNKQDLARKLRIKRAFERYRVIRNARENLRELFEMRAHLEQVYKDFPDEGIDGAVLMVYERAVVVIDKNYTANIRPDLFGKAIQGVDVRNIRECPVCGKVFFARRKDSVVCDPISKCAKTHSKRAERKNLMMKLRRRVNNN
ncbi:MAG: hypothetical protein H0U60_04625 [Blastocatellia bacterium]|nr:hypothetical protein [Blastocatellia bacterium]